MYYKYNNDKYSLLYWNRLHLKQFISIEKHFKTDCIFEKEIQIVTSFLHFGKNPSISMQKVITLWNMSSI